MLTLSLAVTIPIEIFNTNNSACSRTVYSLAACGSYKKRRLTCSYFSWKYTALSVRYELNHYIYIYIYILRIEFIFQMG
jgi:hypothetical protein